MSERRSANETHKAIINALKEAKRPLTFRQLGAAISRRPTNNLRDRVNELIEMGIVVRTEDTAPSIMIQRYWYALHAEFD